MPYNAGPFVSLDSVEVRFPVTHDDSLRQRLARLVSGSTRAVDMPHTALRKVSITLSAGDRVALIGPNGAGKTTLLRVMAGAYTPTDGLLTVRGRVATLLNLGLFVDPFETGMENIEAGCLMLGLPPERIAEVQPRIAEFADLGAFIDRPVRTYSSGMQVRLAFAIASQCDADILLVDEGIGLGDAVFRARVRQRLLDLSASVGILVIASHSSDVLRELCHTGIFLHSGEVVFQGNLEDTIAAYGSWVAADPETRKPLRNGR